MLPFTIQNQLTQSDYSGILLKKTMRRPAMIFFLILGGISLVVNVLTIAGIMASADTGFSLWIFVLFPIVIPLMSVFQARRIYKASRRLQAGVSYTFSEDGLQAKAIDSERSYNWDAFFKCEDKGGFLLLYPAPNTAEIIKKELLTREQVDFIKIKTGRFPI